MNNEELHKRLTRELARAEFLFFEVNRLHEERQNKVSVLMFLGIASLFVSAMIITGSCV